MKSSNHKFAISVLWLFASSVLHADLIHRWSFDLPAGPVAPNTNLTESITAATATLRGIGATSNGTSIVLPGTTSGNQAPSNISAYIDLPNGLISSKTNLTVEIWATPLRHQTFQRLLDFGRITQAGDGLGAPGEITGIASTAPGATSSSAGLAMAQAISANNGSKPESTASGRGTRPVNTASLIRTSPPPPARNITTSSPSKAASGPLLPLADGPHGIATVLSLPRSTPAFASTRLRT